MAATGKSVANSSRSGPSSSMTICSTVGSMTMAVSSQTLSSPFRQPTAFCISSGR